MFSPFRNPSNINEKRLKISNIEYEPKTAQMPP